MKFITKSSLLFAIAYAQNSKTHLEDSFESKWPTDYSPSPTSTNLNLDSGDSRTLEFGFNKLAKKFTHILLLSSESSEFRDPHFVAVYSKSQEESWIFDENYSGLSISGDSVISIKLNSIDMDKAKYYYAVATKDPTFFKNDKFDKGSDLVGAEKSYSLIVYTSPVSAEYYIPNHKVDEQLIVCYVGASQADLHFSHDLPYEQLTQGDSRYKKIPSGAIAIISKKPDSSWFAKNRATDEIECMDRHGNSENSSSKVMRPKNMDDIHMTHQELLIGETISTSCSPVPSRADAVKIFSTDSSNHGTPVSFERIEKSNWNLDGNSIKIPEFQATSAMKSGIACVFYIQENDEEKIVGYTTPQVYEIHDVPTPKPKISAKIEMPKCGFNPNDMEMEIGTCSYDQASFPPVEMRWRIKKSDGTEIYLPEQAVETKMSKLVLNEKFDESFRDAEISCLASRPRANEGEEATVAEYGKVSLRRFTERVIINLDHSDKKDNTGFGDIVCTSEPQLDDECTDIESLTPEKTSDDDYCPFNLALKFGTCTATFKKSVTRSDSEYSMSVTKEEDCIAKDQKEYPSLYNKAPAPESSEATPTSHEDEQSPYEPALKSAAPSTASTGGGSIAWVFFLIAAIGGATLGYLNREKKDTKSPNALLEEDENPRMSKVIDDGQIVLEGGEKQPMV